MIMVEIFVPWQGEFLDGAFLSILGGILLPSHKSDLLISHEIIGGGFKDFWNFHPEN